MPTTLLNPTEWRAAKLAAVCVNCGLGAHEQCDGQAYVDNSRRASRYATLTAWVRCACQRGAHPRRKAR